MHLVRIDPREHGIDVHEAKILEHGRRGGVGDDEDVFQGTNVAEAVYRHLQHGGAGAQHIVDLLETRGVVPAFVLDDAARYAPAGAKKWVERGVLRLTPESGADGFTAFVLRRAGQ